jgi:ketosteroid isomerase-like protein
MKSRILIAASAVLLAATACQPAPEAEPQPTFTAEDEAYAADAVRMPPDEPMFQGHAAIRENQKALPPVTGFTLTPQVIGGEGDLAYARGAFTLDLAPPDADPISMVGKWHAIYERQADGSWVCVSDIWNTDMQM